jgi:hypothetical protein
MELDFRVSSIVCHLTASVNPQRIMQVDLYISISTSVTMFCFIEVEGAQEVPNELNCCSVVAM